FLFLNQAFQLGNGRRDWQGGGRRRGRRGQLLLSWRRFDFVSCEVQEKLLSASFELDPLGAYGDLRASTGDDLLSCTVEAAQLAVKTGREDALVLPYLPVFRRRDFYPVAIDQPKPLVNAAQILPRD